jgi:hypothetical protein
MKGELRETSQKDKVQTFWNTQSKEIGDKRMEYVNFSPPSVCSRIRMKTVK